MLQINGNINRYGVIYKITNILNGKSYIGQTININPMRRVSAHFNKRLGVNLLYKSYLKNNKNQDLYNIDIIYSSFDREDLDKKEQYFIRHFNTLVPNGYNIKSGGEGGGKCAEETKLKISLSHQGKSLNKGVPKTLAHRAAMSKSRKGFTTENRKKAAFNRRGLPMPEKTYKAVMEHSKTRYIKIIAINEYSGVEICFKSITDCSKALNLNIANIVNTIYGKNGRKQHKGYKFYKI